MFMELYGGRLEKSDFGFRAKRNEIKRPGILNVSNFHFGNNAAMGPKKVILSYPYCLTVQINIILLYAKKYRSQQMCCEQINCPLY